jgi:hypothetical protein
MWIFSFTLRRLYRWWKNQAESKQSKSFLRKTRVYRKHEGTESRYLLHAGLLLGLFFYPEDGGDIFLRNFTWFSTGYTALYHRRCMSSQIPLWVPQILDKDSSAYMRLMQVLVLREHFNMRTACTRTVTVKDTSSVRVRVAPCCPSCSSLRRSPRCVAPARK